MKLVLIEALLNKAAELYLDFDDPEELEANLWLRDAKSQKEAEALFMTAEVQAICNRVLKRYDLELHDAEIVDGMANDDELDPDHPDSRLRGGWILHLNFYK